MTDPLTCPSGLGECAAEALRPLLTRVGTSWIGADAPVDLGGVSVSPPLLLMLIAAAFLAGAVDALVGGGGLIQLPALLLIPGIPPVTALATNKLAGFAGTSTAALTYGRRVGADLRVALPTALLALLAASGGARLASLIPADSFTPAIILALLLVLALTLTRPRLFAGSGRRLGLRPLLARALPFGAFIGLYDGVLGPGTGSFLLMAFMGVVGLSALRATALSKLVNAATNLGALVFFASNGSVDWALGLLLAAANTAGGYSGARWATRVGAPLIRRVLIIVVLALILKLAWEYSA